MCMEVEKGMEVKWYSKIIFIDAFKYIVRLALKSLRLYPDVF